MTVDKNMIKKDWVFFSRDVEKIVEYLSNSKKRTPDLNRSKRVKEEVVSKLIEVIEKVE